MKKRANLLAFGGTVTLVSLLFAFPPMFSTALAQTANTAPAASATATKAPERALTYALIAAVGDRFTYVTQKQSTTPCCAGWIRRWRNLNPRVCACS
jgi:hypothetical protein